MLYYRSFIFLSTAHRWVTAPASTAAPTASVASMASMSLSLLCDVSLWVVAATWRLVKLVLSSDNPSRVKAGEGSEPEAVPEILRNNATSTSEMNCPRRD